MADVPTVVLDVDRDLLETLEATLGPPIDSYLMGWQVWLHELDRVDVELELRLHPPGGFELPEGVDHHLLWERVIRQVADGAEVIELGDEERSLSDIWVLLEVYAAHRQATTADELARWTRELLGREPAGAGPVDHDRLSAQFRREGHDADLAAALLAAVVDGG